MEEHILIERAKAGCHAAFSELVTMYYKPVMKHCINILGDATEAEDLAQDVFADVYRGISKFRGDAKFSTWLFQIAANKASKRLRQLNRHCLLFDRDQDPWDDVDLATAQDCQLILDYENRSALSHLLDTLPYLLRESLKLRLSGLKHAEIAQIMHCPVGTVKTRVRKAVNMMKEEVASHNV